MSMQALIRSQSRTTSKSSTNLGTSSPTAYSMKTSGPPLLQTLVQDTHLPHIVLETPRHIWLVVDDHAPDAGSATAGECDDLVQRSWIKQVEMARQMDRAGPRGLPWVEGHRMNQGSRVLGVELWSQVGCMESLLCQSKQALVSRRPGGGTSHGVEVLWSYLSPSPEQFFNPHTGRSWVCCSSLIYYTDSNFLSESWNLLSTS